MQENVLAPIFPLFKRVWNNIHGFMDNFMLWKIIFGSLLTRGRLLNIGIIHYQACVLCGTHPKTIAHLFFNCIYVHSMCKKLNKDGYNSAFRNNNLELFYIFKHNRWRTNDAIKSLSIVKKLATAIWKEHNTRVFSGTKINALSMLRIVQKKIQRSMIVLAATVRPNFPEATGDRMKFLFLC